MAWTSTFSGGIAAVCLALSVLALWIRPARWRPGRPAAWMLGLLSAWILATWTGWLGSLAWAGAGVFAAVVWGESRSRAKGGWASWIAWAAAVLLSAALTAHQWPGFRNPPLLQSVRLRADAIPFSLHLNFDKSLVGLFVLGFGAARLADREGWTRMLRGAAPGSAGVILGVMVLSLSLGYVRFDPAWPTCAPVWLAVNLLLTCVAEEALFRGLIQRRLTDAWQGRSWGTHAALAVGAVLFGVAHLAGGWTYVALATVAGAGYGYVYRKTAAIEAPILTHFALNTVHFFLFTYPALANRPV